MKEKYFVQNIKITNKDVKYWSEQLNSNSKEKTTYELAVLGVNAIPIVEEILFGKTKWGFPYNHQARRGAIIVLRHLGSLAFPAIKTLMKLLQEDNETICIEAIQAIGSIGKDAKEALPILESCCKHTYSNSIPNEAIKAIEKIKVNL